MKKQKQKGQEHCWRPPNKFYKGVKVEMTKLKITKDCYQESKLGLVWLFNKVKEEVQPIQILKVKQEGDQGSGQAESCTYHLFLDLTKVELLQVGIFFLIHLFAQEVLLVKKLEIKETKTLITDIIKVDLVFSISIFFINKSSLANT